MTGYIALGLMLQLHHVPLAAPCRAATGKRVVASEMELSVASSPPHAGGGVLRVHHERICLRQAAATVVHTIPRRAARTRLKMNDRRDLGGNRRVE